MGYQAVESGWYLLRPDLNELIRGPGQQHSGLRHALHLAQCNYPKTTTVHLTGQGKAVIRSLRRCWMISRGRLLSVPIHPVSLTKMRAMMMMMMMAMILLIHGVSKMIVTGE